MQRRVVSVPRRLAKRLLQNINQCVSYSSEISAKYGWNKRTNPAPNGSWINQKSVTWDPLEVLDVSTWLNRTSQDLGEMKEHFDNFGFVKIKKLIDTETGLNKYIEMHDDLQNGVIDAPGRHDLGSHEEQKREGTENVGQIMWPSDLVENSREGPLHERGFTISSFLLGNDFAFDFDMLIYKDGMTDTETPWHQDEAYWPEGMVDKRAITVWCALDKATIDNGAMWFIAGSHEHSLYHHEPAAEGAHILMTESVSESTKGAVCVELEPGDAVLWHGRTCHYSRGNSTDHRRRSFITNFRPEHMVQWERDNGFDHLRKGFEDYEEQMKVAKKNS